MVDVPEKSPFGFLLVWHCFIYVYVYESVPYEFSCPMRPKGGVGSPRVGVMSRLMWVLGCELGSSVVVGSTPNH